MKLDGGQTAINPLFSRVSQEFNNILRVIRESKGNNKLKFKFVGLLVIDMERASTFSSGKSEEHEYDGKDISNRKGSDTLLD